MHSRATHVAESQDIDEQDLARLLVYTNEACCDGHEFPHQEIQEAHQNVRSCKSYILFQSVFIESLRVRESYFGLVNHCIGVLEDLKNCESYNVSYCACDRDAKNSQLLVYCKVLCPNWMHHDRDQKANHGNEIEFEAVYKFPIQVT